ncbi:conserved hypothetical protein [Flavobacterium sp. 9AF]|uniref:Rossmann-like and DUF2520 domain-containing protein n=1 Tax=Flavobacterium sp. 9AF TaxID=2653142 RepID=UPI0012F00B43|nr:Rossmann-like and DUF2520 domain-containing protein [Flavobacterium sp. 9AF]VXB00843.1 conserved hypothetical protein [Flavobacterium sp. 9AF]
MLKVIVIGSGNVAHHLVKVLLKAKNIELVQVVARTKNTMTALLSEDQIIFNYQAIKAADVYIVAVSDNAIEEVSNQLPFENRLVVHTSGTSELSILNSKNRKGVFYPLQTFSKSKEVDFSSIPLCLETENMSDYKSLEIIGKAISNKVYAISSEQRKALHVAAVFVNNFTNHLFQIGNQICKENNIPFEILHALILETAAKITQLNPKEAQTGPALRNDTKTIEKHLEFLKNSNYQDIYQLLTQSIQHVAKEL